ncbi:tectonin domain-containing protein [Aureimonas leprariae]|uniref:PLL-like beta propeller domain-containing protein n=1 Tax=Plantimonas leprariae TaxID=2615207 RepID=A0A7V7TXQ4_9HYPH|nr:tectonin domain-containing protein [Aureimonas leprariae]KAB0681340.1 hypothetical protein F6X38_05495 [Aureimonas leprariae]
MPSFEFADCPTRLQLTATPAGDAQEGKLACSVRSIVPRKVAGRVTVEPEGDAKPDWFRIAGAPSTNPREIELTFEPNAALSFEIEARVPAGTPPQAGSFRLEVISEKDTDTDFVRGPAVSFEIQPWSEKPKPAPRAPWRALAVIAAVVVAMIGGIGWALLPSSPGSPTEFVGMEATKALEAARAAMFSNPAAVAGPAAGAKPGTVTSVALAGNGDLTLYVEPGTRIVSTPAAVSAAPGEIDLFAVGADRQIYRKHYDGTAWAPAYDWEALGGWAISPVAATAANGTIDVVAIGHDKAVYHRFFRAAGEASATWMRIAGTAVRQPSLVRRGDELNLVVIGTDAAMYRKAGQTDLPPGGDWAALSGKFTSPPATVSWGPSRIDMFGLGFDSSLYIRYIDGAADAGGWTSLGGVFSSPVTVASSGLGRLDLAGIGMDGAAYFKRYDGSNWVPNLTDWTRLGGEFVDQPVLVSRAPGKLDLFGVGTNGQMVRKSGDESGAWSPSGTDWQVLGGSFVGIPAAVASGPDRVDVFGLSADGTVYQKTISGGAMTPDGDGWSRIDGLSTER